MVRLSILLHGHLPYGFQPAECPSLENGWLYEAVTESYLPLLEALQTLPLRAGTKGIEQPWLTLSLSPTLISLWRHPDFPAAYNSHMMRLIRLAEAEGANRLHPAERRLLARHYAEVWSRLSAFFNESCQQNLLAAFVKLAKCGIIELITTSATHALLPAFQHQPAVIERQIGEAIRYFNAVSGLLPNGFWLPECGYFPGLEAVLKDYGVRYFALESQAFAEASPRPVRGYLAPVQCANGVRVVARHPALSRRVWDARHGYPGHSVYREFHRDAVHDIPESLAHDFQLEHGRMSAGLKYWAVTGSEDKDIYNLTRAHQQVKRDAADFVQSVERIHRQDDHQARHDLCFLPFDMELFGHWWHEGTAWLLETLHLAHTSSTIEPMAANCAIDSFKEVDICAPTASSWGNHADFSFWLNPETDWLFPLLDAAQTRLQAIAQYLPDAASPALKQSKEPLNRACLQAKRELMLAEASDWPFMIRADTTRDYAVNRLRQHLARCHYLLTMVEHGKPLEAEISLLEHRDRILL